jgi:hypothetical protein
MIMNLGIVEETALGLAICYVPFFQVCLQEEIISR